MKLMFSDADLQYLLINYDPEQQLFYDSFDNNFICDRKDIGDSFYAMSIDMSPLILAYINAYSIVTKNQKIEQARKEQSIKLFYEEIRSNKEESSKFNEFISEMFVPTIEFAKGFPGFVLTNAFIKNYVRGNVSFENLCAHIRAIGENIFDERRKFYELDMIMPEEYYKILDELLEKGKNEEYLVLSETLINSDMVSYERVKASRKILEFKKREEFLLKPENENHSSYYLDIFAEYNVVLNRLKSKLGKYIFYEDTAVGPVPFTEPFHVKLRITNHPEDIHHWIKFIQENNGFFNELRAFKSGMFDVTLIKEVIYYPQNDLDSERTPEELSELGVYYRIDFLMGGH